MSLKTPRGGGLKTTRGGPRRSSADNLKSTRGLKMVRGKATTGSFSRTTDNEDVDASAAAATTTTTTITKSSQPVPSTRPLGGASRGLKMRVDVGQGATAATTHLSQERSPPTPPDAINDDDGASSSESVASDTEPYTSSYMMGDDHCQVDQDIFIHETPASLAEEVIQDLEGLAGITQYEWNDRFQAILAKECNSRKDKVERVVAIRRLLRLFEEKAKECAICIVQELQLPKSEKTIPPIDAGGVAGGQKFLSDGIFFKLAIDWKKVYSGNDEAAMKAAGHELNGLRAYFRSKVRGLYVPLMVAIDYRGYRMLASSLLPISGSKTLVYGSPDGGKTVHKSNSHMNKLMEKAARGLNLKAHWGGSKATRKFLHGPVDLEGHVGHDGKLYVLDTARVFPPESPTRAVLLIPQDKRESIRVEQLHDEALSDKEKFFDEVAAVIGCSPGEMGIHSTSLGTFYFNTKGKENERAMLLPKKGSDASLRGDVVVVQYNMQVIYYRLLRPELVRDYATPLCSDAFSRFQRCDENMHEHNKEVTDATRRLINILIPSFARKLKTHKLVPVNHEELIKCMHDFGINVRFLGRIRQRVDASHSHLRSFLLTEMCARVIKHKIRKIMRKYSAARGATLGSSGMRRSMHHLRAQGSDRELDGPGGSGAAANAARDLFLSSAATMDEESEDSQTRPDEIPPELAQRLVDYLNVCLGKSPASTDYWKKKLKLLIQFKFLHALADDEARVDYDLRKVVLMFPLFMRLQETTGVIFKTAVQKRLFDHPLTFDMPDPLRTDDLLKIEATTKNVLVRTGELKSKLYKALTLEREKDSEEALMSNFAGRDDILGAYNTLINLYHHKHICDYISTNSPEAIQSYYRLAQSYKQMGNTARALDFALKGLYHGEVLFGSFSEETMEGLRTVGEIFEHAGKEEETVKFYRRALHAVEKMYFLHPIAGKLHLKLYFLLRKRSASEARTHLQRAYAAYGGIYGYEKARLVVPLLALKNQIQPVVRKMDETLANDEGEGSLMQMAHQFWPAELLESVSSHHRDTNNHIQKVLTKLDLEEHILSFQYHEVDEETFLGLTDADLVEIGMNHQEERQRLLDEIDLINEKINQARMVAAASSDDGAVPQEEVVQDFDEYTIASGVDTASQGVQAVTTAELEEDPDFVLY